MSLIFMTGLTSLVQAGILVAALWFWRAYGARRASGILLVAFLFLAICVQPLGRSPVVSASGLVEVQARLAASLFMLLVMAVLVNAFTRIWQTQDDLLREKRQLRTVIDRRVADLELEIAERVRAEEALREDATRFNAIISTQNEIATAELGFQAILDLIAERAEMLTHAEGAIVQLREDEELVFRSACGHAASFLGLHRAPARSLSRLCLETGQTLHCDDTERDERVDLAMCRRLGVRSLVTVPILHNRVVVGVLQVLSAEPYAFGAIDSHTLQLMAGLIGAAMSRQAEFEAKQSLLAEALERADRDALTGLLNHRAFHKRLEVESDRVQTNGAQLAIAMIDLDNFKFFNDTYGHIVGDDVLKKVAAALAGGCAPGDTAARFGGDEFALLMPGVDANEAAACLARVCALLSEDGYRLPHSESVIPISLSFGVALFPQDAPTRLEALEFADARLRHSKTGGLNDGALTDHLLSRLAPSMNSFSILNALVSAVDNKDRYTRRHSEDVMLYSLQIAQKMGLDAGFQHMVEVAALLHDVGKIGVPDAILRKPGHLTREELDAVKLHPVMGAIIVAAVPGFEDTLDAIRHHHERWDGKGYPNGLSGNEIPLIASLMAVADAYSAMTTDRPYRKGMPSSKALEILEAGAGVQWDPACVAAFLAARQEGTLASKVQDAMNYQGLRAA